MNSIESLTVKTTAALNRFTDLQRRASVVGRGTPPGVLKHALRELSEALEELQVANDHLQEQLTALAGARQQAEDAWKRFDDFINVLPTPCVWTDKSGMIRDANGAAATLLNVARQRLGGKPLMLFLADREGFFEALNGLGATDGGSLVLTMVIRPRERRPRAARLIAARSPGDDRYCWFITADEDTDGAKEVVPSLNSR